MNVPQSLVLGRGSLKNYTSKYPEMHSLALFVLSVCYFFVKHFPNQGKTLFRGWFLKNSYIQIKNWYVYKLVRTAKQSELERSSKYYSRNHKNQCKLFMLKKKWILAWSIAYLNEWKHFRWQFVSLFFSSVWVFVF